MLVVLATRNNHIGLKMPGCQLFTVILYYINLLLAECEVRTASYGPSFFLPLRLGHENKEGKTCRTDRANEANKMFIICLCWLFRFWKGDQETRARGPYGYLRTWNWPITAREISQPYNKLYYCTVRFYYIYHNKKQAYITELVSARHSKLEVHGFRWFQRLPQLSSDPCTEIIRSWKVVEFENEFSRPGKVIDFRKNGRGHGKYMSCEISYFGTTISCCLKTWNILLVIGQKYAPKRVGFQHLLFM